VCIVNVPSCRDEVSEKHISDEIIQAALFCTSVLIAECPLPNGSVFRRFSRWSLNGVWRRMFAAMSDDPDFEYLIIDSTIVRAHQHAAGAKKRV
jgi:transposase